MKKINLSDYIDNYEEYNSQILNKFNNISNYENSKNLDQKKIESILKKEMFLNKSKSLELSKLIYKSSKKYKIDSRIIISILKVESNFDQSAINLSSCKNKNIPKCGDYSIAQINYNIWSKNFLELGREPLSFYKLKNSVSYSIDRMAEILSILKDNYGESDKLWFARYHSSTPFFKNRYVKVLKKEFKKIIRSDKSKKVSLN